jgi:pilus assembly protein Flp/PilA
VTKTKAVIALIRASFLTPLWKDEGGQDLIEYALIAGFIGLGTVLGVHGLAAQIAGFVNTVSGGFAGDINGAI